MRHSVKLDCKTHHISKDGTIPILLRVTLNGEQDYFNIGKRINAKFYDKKAKSLAEGTKGAGNYVTVINRHKVMIETIIDDFDKKGQIVSLSKVKAVYNEKNGVGNSISFYDFVEKRIEWEKKHTQIKVNTFKNYEGNFTKLKKYRNNLSIHDIDVIFLEEYKSHILKTEEQSQNTAYHAMTFIRKYTKMLYHDGKISQYAFNTFKVGSPYEVKVVYLEPEELIALHDLYDSKELLKIVKHKKNKYARDFNIGEKLQDVLRYFLVACYTGFRHSDIKTLRKEHIKGDTIVKEIIKTQENIKVIVEIPIVDSYHSLLKSDNPNGLIFDNPVMEDSQSNKYLKQIMKIAKIDKHITFHKARYTFAINSLILGLPITVVSDILGHTDLKTTQRYAKVASKLKKQEMLRWNNLRPKKAVADNIEELTCSNCHTLIMKYQKGVINQNTITCNCPNCKTSNFFELQKDVIIIPANFNNNNYLKAV
jgi:integrase